MPAQELNNGGFAPFAEHPGRAEAILGTIGLTGVPADHGEEPLLRVHSREYLDFLKNAHSEWRGAGRSGDASGYVWPIVGRRPLNFSGSMRVSGNIAMMRPRRLRKAPGLQLIGGLNPVCLHWGLCLVGSKRRLRSVGRRATIAALTTWAAIVT